jgi:hypothetical protein
MTERMMNGGNVKLFRQDKVMTLISQERDNNSGNHVENMLHTRVTYRSHSSHLSKHWLWCKELRKRHVGMRLDDPVGVVKRL